jgi:dihydrofolate synthase/folylpolyglutamate synthase
MRAASAALNAVTQPIVKPGLERARYLLQAIGNPDHRLPAIHITGTNGKGSVARGCATLLLGQGFKVGLYTSPHVQSVRERIQLNLRQISPRHFQQAVDRILPACQALQRQGDDPSWFEAITVAAAAAFETAGMDVVVLEVGLGGRWDATTAWEKRILTIITRIDLEHEAYLGRTLTAITREKAGIIKSRVPLLTAEPRRRLRQLLAKQCRSAQARLIEVGAGPNQEVRMVFQKSSSEAFGLVHSGQKLGPFQSGLRGSFQRANAALAIAAMLELQTLGWNIQLQRLGLDLAQIRWPGRFEIIASHPTIILDGAHNPAAWRMLFKELRKQYPEKAIEVVLAVLKDKNIKPLGGYLKNHRARVWACSSPGLRGLEANALARQLSRSGVPVKSLPSLGAAVRSALKAARPNGVVVITGSFMHLHAARTHIRKLLH